VHHFILRQGAILCWDEVWNAEINEDEISKVMPSIKVRDFIKKADNDSGPSRKLNAILAEA
jgi:hypothetical protein